MSTAILRATDRTWLAPFVLAVPFAAIMVGFNASDMLPVPLAIAVGAGWGIALGLITTWMTRKSERLSAWLGDSLVLIGTTAFAFSGCGGLMAILMLKGALDSPSLTGQTLQSLFLPSIPLARRP